MLNTEPLQTSVACIKALSKTLLVVHLSLTKCQRQNGTMTSVFDAKYLIFGRVRGSQCPLREGPLAAHSSGSQLHEGWPNKFPDI